MGALENSVDPDAMPGNAALCQDLLCLLTLKPKSIFRERKTILLLRNYNI